MVDTRWTHTNTTVYNIGYRLIWCLKYRWKVLVSGVEKRLKELIYKKANEMGVAVETLEIMPDHLHLLSRHRHQRRLFGLSSR